jgi:[acyl-carrier-protein] S-malonyltransferase
MGLYSAVAFTGALTFEATLTLARDICSAAHTAMGDRRWSTGAVVGFSSPRVRELVEQAVAGLEVTDQCGSATLLFTGQSAAVKPVLDQCLAEGAPLTRLIPVTAPFHTTVLEGVKPLIEACLDSLDIQAPSCPIVSAITQDVLTTAQDVRAEFGRNILSPMDWQATMARIMKMAPDTVLEAGASSVLCDVVRDDHPQACSVLDWHALQVQAA